MFKNVEKIIGLYQKPKVSFHPYNPKAPKVASIIKEQIETYLPEVRIEHIGSTAVPNCPGKGIVDLMALYQDNHLESVKTLLLSMGFQRQGKEFRNRFPDERPVYMGTFEYDKNSFLLYIHVILHYSYEATRFRIFRDRLCTNPKLLSEYVSVKKRIISEGVIDTDDYADMKQKIARKILGNDYDENNHSKFRTN